MPEAARNFEYGTEEKTAPGVESDILADEKGKQSGRQRRSDDAEMLATLLNEP